jgi:hypothetical protein
MMDDGKVRQPLYLLASYLIGFNCPVDCIGAVALVGNTPTPAIVSLEILAVVNDPYFDLFIQAGIKKTRATNQKNSQDN